MLLFIRDTTESIWAFTGAVLALILIVGLSSIIRQIRHNSTGSSQADRWELSTDAVLGFIDGDEVRMEKFSKLLRRDETKAIVIEAFSNIARANPNCAVTLRHRADDVAILRQWVADSLEDKDAGRRAHACEVVATLRLRACRGMVLAATGDDDVNVKVSACRALAVIDPTSTVGVLLGLIEDEGTWAADLLSDLLLRIPGEATDAVIERARQWGATPALVKLLAISPTAKANDILLSALETEDPDLRARTAEAIHASTPEAITALTGLLTDANESTRLNAVRSLSRAQNPQSLLTLSSALSDPSRLVRFAAAAGIAGTVGGDQILLRVVRGSDGNAAEAAELALWRITPTPAQITHSQKPAEIVGSTVPTVPSIDTLASTNKTAAPTPTTPSTATTSLTPIATANGAAANPVPPSQLPVATTNASPADRATDVAAAADSAATVKAPTTPTTPSRSTSTPTTPTTPINSTSAASATGVSVANSSTASVARPSLSLPTTSVAKPGDQATRNPHHASQHKRGSKRATLASVESWLVEFLRAHNGLAPVPTVKRAASNIGIAERTLERARPQVANTIPRQAGEPASWELLSRFIENPETTAAFNNAAATTPMTA